MSIKLMALAFDARVSNPLRKLVLLKLCDHANEKGQCWPSFSYIADQCEISRRSAISHIQALIADGYLASTPRFKEGEQTTNIYTINVSRLIKSVESAALGSATGAPTLVQMVPDSGAGDAPRTTIEPSILTIIESNTPQAAPATPTQTKPDYPDWFADLWKLYPQRAGGNDKRKAYKAAQARIKQGRSIGDLISAVNRYRAYVAATGRLNTEYVKQGATFFNTDSNIDESWAPPAAGATSGQYKTAAEKEAERNAYTFDLERARNF